MMYAYYFCGVIFISFSFEIVNSYDSFISCSVMDIME